jgi:hypothetical protein
MLFEIGVVSIVTLRCYPDRHIIVSTSGGKDRLWKLLWAPS